MMRFGVPRSRQRGFKFLELLVILAILVVLIGMLIPAVRKVRETAALSACRNNLRHVGMAIQNYHNAMGHYPAGGTHLPPKFLTSAPPNRRDLWSWAYQILPYLDEGRIHSEADPDLIFRTPIRAYYCPARRPVAPMNGLAKIDYAGNAGTDPNGRNGMVVRTGYGMLRRSAVVDGAAQTILVAEKRLNLARLGATDDDDESYVNPGWNGDLDVYRWGKASPLRDRTDPERTKASCQFGSSHPLGMNALFGDGSVRHALYTIHPDVFRKACVRNDQANYDPGDF